ncbi:fumarylacetoacetate hydrolase family protein [Quisquiliibacterium transsilvanicum]|uniref:Fumarylpyruvate hydrolase n=1 Tax=Quisquiliibacterium transsilvanicum TaxID=1549638 RepID=A0A7W8M9B1_9BURK|nr:fumarylacetoacetate hydrolase family protein [Quisquiliibacterium transsilvanicum]MBB5272846.1 fumarylpyruvate hydrolase [Quisquiliibacterium transsilvanicum]
MKYAFPLLPPVSVPVAGTDLSFPVHRIYCVGRNYAEHAKEMGFTGREPPFFFMKPADALVVVGAGCVGEIPYPPGTRSLHHEIELVIAIGQGGHDIAAADAMRHVYGYAVGLDMTRRDLQNEAKKLGRPWEIGKSHDASAPIGPIIPREQAGDATDAAISLSVNDETRQSSSTSQLIWSIGEIVEHLSRYWTLLPGDLIFTGTPEGVGEVRSGDLMRGRVEGVGALDVRIV